LETDLAGTASKSILHLEQCCDLEYEELNKLSSYSQFAVSTNYARLHYEISESSGQCLPLPDCSLPLTCWQLL